MSNELERLRDLDILIVGFGREGQSTYHFIRKFFPEKKIGIADRQKVALDDPHAIKYTGDQYLNSLREYDIVFKSPGIPETLPQIHEAKERGIKITSQTRLFFAICQGEIIGITGTKGKSTTASLVHHILTEAGKSTVLLGNIGKPCIDYLDEGFGRGVYFCFELSSYQLSDLDRSPHVGVFLNIFREHLDYHGSEKAYFEAKSNITKHQSKRDFFVYNMDFKSILKLANETTAKAEGFSLEPLEDSNAFIENGELMYRINKGVKKVIALKDIPLIGEHNLNNVMAAILAARSLGVSLTKIAEAIKTFKPLEHRLQIIAEKNGVRFVDDALATIPEATIAAIRALDGQVGSVILGGTDRGQDFEALVREILEQNISAVALFPDTGERIWRAIEQTGSSNLPKHIFVQDMEEAVDFCYKNTPKGKICLLSTASPSYSLFRDYEDKANHFKDAIRGLK